MNETKHVKSPASGSVILIATLGLLVVLMAGCQQANNPANSNTATNANANANANTSTAKTFKNDLTGTWVGIDDPKKKVTFTADEMIAFEDGKETRLKYTRLSDDEIEVTLDGAKKKAKTTLEGDSLTIAGDEVVKFKRESATAANNTAANTPTSSKEEVPLTPEAKAFKNNLVGKWSKEDEYGPEIITFSENTMYSSRNTQETYTYRVMDEKTLEFKTDANGYIWKGTFKIEDDGNTLVWQNLDNGTGSKYKRVK